MELSKIMVALAAIVVEEWGIFIENAKPPEFGVRNANLTPTIPVPAVAVWETPGKARMPATALRHKSPLRPARLPAASDQWKPRAGPGSLNRSYPAYIPTRKDPDRDQRSSVMVQGHPVCALLLGK
ncbi:hypothetical protein DV515_00014870, partial [Chloebia gouldiae]